ncbi:hypothetical protein CR513_34542, partial [Mucuna pruriens]
MRGEIIVSCGSYPNVPLVGPQGAINYNPLLALRQGGYPIRQPPSDLEVTPFVIHGPKALKIGNLRKIAQAWQHVVQKGAELDSRSFGASQSYKTWLQARIQAIGLIGGLPYVQSDQGIEIPEVIKIEEFEQILGQLETEQQTLKRKLEQKQAEVLQERLLKEESMKKARLEHQYRIRMASCLQAADVEMGLRRVERNQMALENESLKETITTLEETIATLTVDETEKDNELRSLRKKVHSFEAGHLRIQADLELSVDEGWKSLTQLVEKRTKAYEAQAVVQELQATIVEGKPRAQATSKIAQHMVDALKALQATKDSSKISKELAQLLELCEEFRDTTSTSSET